MVTQRIVICPNLKSMCSCQRTFGNLTLTVRFLKLFQVVGVTGFEPVTLRLSSACSNQLSYTPALELLLIKSVGGAEEIRTPDL